MSSNHNRQKKIVYRGNTFTCYPKCGKVTVRSERTAKGQSIVAGTLILDGKIWENSSNNVSLPEYVKKAIEMIFCKA